jgi:hypothetical protein
MILENVSLMMDMKREYSRKKNKNIESSTQYNLRKAKIIVSRIVSRFERNIIRLCKTAPKVMCDPTQAKANRNTLNRFVRKKR